MATSAFPASATGLAPRSLWVRSRGVIGLALLAPFLLGALLSPLHAAPGALGEWALGAAGWLLCSLGTGVRFWATLYIGGRKGQGVAQDGPYSICRNPLYNGSFLILAGFACFVQSLTFCAGMLLTSAVYLVMTVGSEEHRLRAKFGAEYVAYCRSVPRFWPRWSSLRAAPQLEINVSALWKETLNAGRYVWLPVLGELIVYARASGILPALFDLP